MKTVVISILTEEEKQGLSYRGIDAKLQALDSGSVLESQDEQEIIDFISGFNSDEQGLIFTFLGHGGNQGIASSAGARVYYHSLLTALSRTKTDNPVFVNLMANCNSVNSLHFLPEENLISEIWYTVSPTSSIHWSLLASQHGSFERVKNLLTEGADHYRIWHNNI